MARGGRMFNRRGQHSFCGKDRGGRTQSRRYFDNQDDQRFGCAESDDIQKLRYLPDEAMSYWRNVSTALENIVSETEDEQNPEAKAEFLNNVFSVLNDDIKVSENQTVSWRLEQLFAQSEPQHLFSVLGSFCKELTLIVFDQFSSHVFQALVEYMPAMYQNLLASEIKEQLQQFNGYLEQLCKFMESHLCDVMNHKYGSHVLRALLKALGGIMINEQLMPGKKSKKEKAQNSLLDYTVNAAFSRDYRHQFQTLTQKIIKLCSIADHLKDLDYCPVIQIVLLILHKHSPDEYSQLSNTILEKTCLNQPEDKTSTDPTERLPDIVQNESGSYLFELLLSLAPEAQLRYIYDNVIRDRIIYFSVHPRANYILQTLLSCAKEPSLVSEVLDHISEFFEDILAINHPGIIIKLAEACQRVGVGQDKFLKVLMSAFHCYEPTSRQVKVVPLVASYLTYNIFNMKVEDEEGEQGKPQPQSTPAAGHVKDVNLHGSLLLQQLMVFTKPNIVVTSLLELSPSELTLIACHKCGSHVIDAFMRSHTVLDKSKDSFLQKMMGMYVELAISIFGSRCMDTIWKNCSLRHRKLIAADLCKSTNRLAGDRIGKHICYNFDLTRFTQRPKEWIELQGASTKRQNILKDILKGKSHKNTRNKLRDGSETDHIKMEQSGRLKKGKRLHKDDETIESSVTRKKIKTAKNDPTELETQTTVDTSHQLLKKKKKKKKKQDESNSVSSELSTMKKSKDSANNDGRKNPMEEIDAEDNVSKGGTKSMKKKKGKKGRDALELDTERKGNKIKSTKKKSKSRDKTVKLHQGVEESSTGENHSNQHSEKIRKKKAKVKDVKGKAKIRDEKIKAKVKDVKK